MSHRQKIEKIKQIEILIFWPVQNDFLTILKKIGIFSIFFENLQKSIKSDVSDTNGPRKRDFHEETIPIDTGETDFRSTVTHFMIFLFDS